MMSVRPPKIICPHCDLELVRVGGNGVPRALECFCGYVWCLDKGPAIVEERKQIAEKRRHHVTEEDFNRIKALDQEGHSQKQIAVLVGRSAGTVCKFCKMDEYVRSDYYNSGELDEKRTRILELFDSREHKQKDIAKIVEVSQSYVSKTIAERRAVAA